MEHTLQTLPERFPQLKLPIRAGMRGTPEYKAAVLRGEEVREEIPFPFGPGDSLTTAETPAGPAEILFLRKRESFLRAYRALGYRCEPVEIEDSVGAAALRGLIDWGKIRGHKAEYLAAGGQEILFKQLAGVFARRIVCYAKDGLQVQGGAQCGIIKFGSRIDLFLPLDAKVKVTVGDSVRACETVLAEL